MNFEAIAKFHSDILSSGLLLLLSNSRSSENLSMVFLFSLALLFKIHHSLMLKTMLATQFTLSLDHVPTPDDLRMKSRQYLLIKPSEQSCYSNYGNYNGTKTGASSSWYRPRDDMDKRRSCANCGSMDPLVSVSSLYKQIMKAIGDFHDDVDATDNDVRVLIMKYGPRCFFCSLEGHFKSGCTQFWDAVADSKHPRHEEALSWVKGNRARLINETKLRKKEVHSQPRR